MSTAARPKPAPSAALWLAMSVLVHGAIVLASLMGEGAWRAHEGDRGHGGAGGPMDLVAITIVSPSEQSDAPPTLAPPTPESPSNEAPAEAAQEAPRGAVERTRTSATTPTHTTTTEQDAPRTTPHEGTTPRTPGDEGGREGDAPSGASTAATSGPSSAGPTSSAGTSAAGTSGLAGVDNAHERAAVQAILGSAGRLEGESVRASALLGENLSCEDPIQGTWVAYRYSPEFRDWARFTLRVRRDGPSLEGTIVARMWRGLPSERRPPPCSADGWDYTVTMRASGNLLGDRMAFGANTHDITRVDCASRFFAYNPDRFTGRVDALSDRMHTVNNDGGRDVDAPYEFRRTSCAP